TAGREVAYRPVSGEQARAGTLAAGLDAWRVDGLIEMYGFYAAGYATATSDAVPVLSGRPVRSFADFVAAHAGVFR
ncbi:MAG: hypothetical protein QOE61_875, partial [Micromonosporaceae bacterium]|nr:hypothetical protein [Micromonosporaceae bacterium]